MTTEKVQSKIKSSTIAITVLSILLALAVASTIVLAAFSANRQATTTITFGGGIQLEISNTTMNPSAQWKINALDNSGTAGADITTSATALTNGAQFAPFTIKNVSSAPIAIAFKLEKTGTAGLYVATDGTTANETTALDVAEGTLNYNVEGTEGSAGLVGWVVISSVAANANAQLVKAINSVYSAEKIAALAGGETATLTLKITAVYAGTDANTALAAEIAKGSWTTISSGEVAA